MKKYVVIAGVNGAGKSTFFSTEAPLSDIVKINLDDEVRRIGDWRNMDDVLKATKILLGKIEDCFKNNVSFSQETTLCGRKILDNIYRAKEQGYTVEVFYIGLESAEIAIQRVQYRVSRGGHGVSDADIERRYSKSLENLKKIIPICDYVTIYDNTDALRCCVVINNGKVIKQTNNVPLWYKQFFE